MSAVDEYWKFRKSANHFNPMETLEYADMALIGLEAENAKLKVELEELQAVVVSQSVQLGNTRSQREHELIECLDTAEENLTAAQRRTLATEDEYKQRCTETATAWRKEMELRKQLETILERARIYKGVESYPCPLCTYKEGIFVEPCQLHKDLHALELTWREECTSLKKQLAEWQTANGPGGWIDDWRRVAIECLAREKNGT